MVWDDRDLLAVDVIVKPLIPKNHCQHLLLDVRIALLGVGEGLAGESYWVSALQQHSAKAMGRDIYFDDWIDVWVEVGQDGALHDLWFDVVKCGLVRFHPAEVQVHSGASCCEGWGKYGPMYVVMPMNLCSYSLWIGAGRASMATTLSGSGRMPWEL